MSLCTFLRSIYLYILKNSFLKLNVLQPANGYFELNPENLYKSVKESIKLTVKGHTGNSSYLDLYLNMYIMFMLNQYI